MANCEDYEEIEILSNAEKFESPLSEENKQHLINGFSCDDGGLDPVKLNTLLDAVKCLGGGEDGVIPSGDNVFVWADGCAPTQADFEAVYLFLLVL